MYKYVPTLTDYIITEQENFPKAQGSFTALMTQIENSAKIIASHVKASGLVDIMGKTGNINTFGEEVQKLDEFSNKLLLDTLINSGEVYAVISEEMEDPVFAPKDKSGEYIVFFDPLDGSSNIDTNCPIGTIFSIYHKSGGLLQKGRDQVAAGYIIYGSSVMFVYTFGKGVNGFTLDPSVGSFLLSHPNIKIPTHGSTYSINQAYEKFYSESTRTYIESLRNNGESSLRYVGSLVSDAHRTFIKGGIYLYPSDLKHPEGKLRLMLEVNPFAFITEQTGGKAIAQNKENPLGIVPLTIHQRSPFIMGSEKNIEEFLSFQQ